MRPIKFRGRRSDGTFVYGLYVNIHGDDFIRDENNRGWPVTNVAQLVGYDSNGAELYEGDKVLRYDNEEEFAETPENGRLVAIPFYTELDSPLGIYYIVKAKEATL